MKQRKSAFETIWYRGNELASVPICEASKRVVKLMEEDYIEIHFSLAKATYFPLGAYCDDELFGRFYITEEQMPKYNTSTGGYDYELKMEAWYRAWKNKLFMMVDTVDGNMYVRKEVTWTLANTLIDQMREFCINLQMCGAISGEYNFRVGDEDLKRYIYIHAASVLKAKTVQVMTYDSTNMIDALNSLAEMWECEWWIVGTEGNFVIHFGKCENGERITLKVGENIESVDFSKDESKYANKIFAFGGTSNIPPGYRKELRATVRDTATVQHNGNAVTMYSLDSSRLFQNSMFSNTGTTDSVLTGIINEGVSNTFENQTNIPSVQTKMLLELQKNYYADDIPQGGDTSHSSYEFLLYDNNTTIDGNTGTLKIAFTSGSAMVQGDAAKESLSLHVFLRIILQYRDGDEWSEAAMYCDNEYEEPLKNDAYQINSSSQYWHVKMAGKEVSYEFTPENLMPGHFGTGNMRVIAKVEVALKSSGAITIPQGTWSANIDYYNQIKIKDVEADAGIGISWVHGNQKYAARIMFAPCNVRPGTYDNVSGEPHPLAQYYYWFSRYGKSDGSQALAEIPNLSIGDEITLDSSAAFGVPSAYYVDNLDDPASLRKIGDKRLRLPNKRIVHGDWVLTRGGYVIHKDYEDAPGAHDVQELSIAFDTVYPDGKLQVEWVQGEYKTDNVTFEGETQEAQFPYRAFHLHLKTLDGKEFPFDNKYRLENEKLELRFLIPEDTLGSENEMTAATYPNNFKLAGMKFEVVYNKDINFYIMEGGDYIKSERDYLIVRNDDYSAKLPNDILYPTVNDPCVLEGWNVKSMSHLGLIAEAEERLADMAFAYAEALQQGSFSFECSMMSNFLDENSLGYNDLLGRCVSIDNEALAKNKETRVIGYELKLDIPYDSPSLTCGETDAYSRLKMLEKGIKELKSPVIQNSYYSSTGLTKADFGDGYTMEIDTGGDTLIGRGETKVLTCIVYNALNNNVTADVTAWTVARDSGNETQDTAWGYAHKTFAGTLTITLDDLQEAGKVMFTFTAIMADEETVMAKMIVS